MMLRIAATVAFTVSALLVSTRSGWSEEACPRSQLPPVAAAATKARLASGHEALIVALGSSSTEGVQATSAANTYPARLQGDLSAAFPDAHFAVINRGIGGQDAVEEVARLEADVVALRPDMVIWQVGANAAMANSDPDVFRKLVSTGIERMKSLGVDVVLMDNQRSAMIMASPQHAVMEQILADLAVKYNVSLFSRGSLMDGWRSGGLAYDHFLAKDFVHMNDLGYHCTADALAASIEAGLGLGDTTRPTATGALHASR